MPFWPLDNPDECEAEFRAKFNRPPPWFELLSTADLDDLAWQLSTRLGLQPPTMRLDTATSAAAERILKGVQFHPMYRGSTEPLTIAVPRLGIPTDGAVWLWRAGDTAAARLRFRDVIAFESLLWRDESWVIDEHAHWLLYGPHDRLCGWLRLANKRRAE